MAWPRPGGRHARRPLAAEAADARRPIDRPVAPITQTRSGLGVNTATAGGYSTRSYSYIRFASALHAKRAPGMELRVWETVAGRGRGRPGRDA